MKKKTTTPSHYACVAACGVRLTNGTHRQYPVGTVISAAAWRALPVNTQGRFEPVARAARGAAAGAADLVPDSDVLAVLLGAHETGEVLTGSYSDVWAQVALELGVAAPFCHFRGLQLARVGREWERITRASFASLCPELVGSDWVSALA
jgi:hypothetical protein